MRGKVFQHVGNIGVYGITPAYAGKSKNPCCCQSWFWDHPRLCGEKYLYESEHCLPRGSPPPMRGKGQPQRFSEYCKGITPAYAGKRSATASKAEEKRDHPRLCGEKVVPLTSKINKQGSSPPMRGKVRVGEAYSRAYRITPAYAGKSKKSDMDIIISQDHPRLCGEKFRIPRMAASQLGSPPPMRGKVILYNKIWSAFRITPAYAGKSDMDSPDFSRSKDHPRLCGEKPGNLLITSNAPGSPPPMRGKALKKFSVFPRNGITPAYAGKRFQLW